MTRIVFGLLLAATVLVFATASARATTLPTGFTETVIAEDLSQPTTVAWAPDGRMFIAERDGVVKVTDARTAPATKVLLDISHKVASEGERGLLGMAVDTRFARNGYLYLLYTYLSRPEDPAGAQTARLTRVKVRPDNRVSREKVLIGNSRRRCPDLDNRSNCMSANAFSHTIGTVISAKDGTLWLSNGENADFSRLDPRSLHVYDKRSLSGKILRVDRKGRGVKRNPFCKRKRNRHLRCTKVYASGFRNPFRFSLGPDGKPIVGDVGWGMKEEVNWIRPGRSYGWPCFEGSNLTPNWYLTPECKKVYEAGKQTPPSYEYFGPGTAIVVGPVYDADSYPASYRGSLFIGDYVRGWLRTLNTANRSLTFSEEWASGWSGHVDLKLSPRGTLVYVDIGFDGQGLVKEVEYSTTNQRPAAAISTSEISGPAPLEVSFDGTASSDPDGTPLRYLWSFGDGETAEGPTVSHTYPKGDYTARLTVSDSEKSHTRIVKIFSGNTPPSIRVGSPSEELRYTGGQRIALRAHAEDAEDGALRGSSVSWNVVIVHGDHEHAGGTLRGHRRDFYFGTSHDIDSHYRIQATATDSGGLSTSTRFLTVHPKPARVGLRSRPPGVPLAFSSDERPAPWWRTTAAGFRTSLSAPAEWTQDGTTWSFVGWSDGKRRSHQLTVPEGASRYTARYRHPDESLVAVEPGSARVRRGVLRVTARCLQPLPKTCKPTLRLGRTSVSISIEGGGRKRVVKAPVTRRQSRVFRRGIRQHRKAVVRYKGRERQVRL